MNIIGMTIDRLKVMEEDHNRPGYFICQCQCGNTVSIKAYSLTKRNPTRSCGCLRTETARMIGVNNLNKAHELNRKYNTKFQVIECSHNHKNNTSGYTGVHLKPSNTQSLFFTT